MNGASAPAPALLPQVERAHTASGRFDMILTVVPRDTAALDQTLDTIGAMPGVTDTESLTQFATKIDRPLSNFDHATRASPSDVSQRHAQVENGTDLRI